MKNITILTALLFSASAFSQIGINTSNPQAVFNIDAAKDNPSTGIPSLTQQSNDFVVSSSGNIGIGNTAPTRKMDIVKTTGGALKITDGTEGNNKIFVSNPTGIGTWQNTSPAVVITSTIGTSSAIGTAYTYMGSSATVTIPGYYVISPRLIVDKAPTSCGSYIAYNLSTSQTIATNAAYPSQDAHFSSGTLYDFMYSSNIGYLQAGTYYMIVRYSGGCTSYDSRANAGQNSFTLILLK
ncbi:hypothetical protein [Chryseobacterium sp. ERMR1:04]|uniref:hypothetical protein n=1 Tax=Chryseobacterium sp. ERMR1:04 TaxID=1705393 RepID=UPI0006C83E3C|nr:hypothetical protein [Chryseobacterium sp. ERMR1:04]